MSPLSVDDMRPSKSWESIGTTEDNEGGGLTAEGIEVNMTVTRKQLPERSEKPRKKETVQPGRRVRLERRKYWKSGGGGGAWGSFCKNSGEILEGRARHALTGGEKFSHNGVSETNRERDPVMWDDSRHRPMGGGPKKNGSIANVY